MTGFRFGGVGPFFVVFVACSVVWVQCVGLMAWSWSEAFDLADLYPVPGSMQEVAIESALEVWRTVTNLAFWASVVSALGAGVSGIGWAVRASR